MKLKNKFIISLILALFVSGTLFFLISQRLFNEDKLFSVTESSLAEAEIRAKQVSFLSNTHSLTANSISELFEKSNYTDMVLINKAGFVLAGPQIYLNHNLKEYFGNEIYEKINDVAFSNGAFVFNNVSGVKHLVAFSLVPDSENFVLVMTNFEVLNRIYLIFFAKSFLVLVSILSLAVILGILVIRQVTDDLERLQSSVIEFGKGNLSVSANISTTKEIMVLGSFFNKMTKQIVELLGKVKTQATLELELSIAQKVQKLFFKANSHSFNRLFLSAFYQPATKCSGDWWHYFTKDDTMFLCIGDVTGHGASSAMLTAAARSALSIIEKMPRLSPRVIAHELNQCLFETCAGDLTMTFLIIAVDSNTGACSYTNASHTPSILIKNKQGQIKKGDLVFLYDVHGKAMGLEQESEYSESSLVVESGDVLFLYTDGLYDLQNRKAEKWEEKNLIKNLLLAHQSSGTAEQLTRRFTARVRDFNQGADLIDDISFMVARLE